MTWPLPEARIEAFLHSCDRVLVLEEGEPLLEGSVRALAQKCGCKARIEGKDETLTVLDEYSTTLVLRRVADYLDCPCPVKASSPVVRELPVRPPNLCAGCSHRAVYYAVRHTFGDDACYSSDIGCYTLGMLPPLRMADFLVCMGSSVSAGSGFARASGKPVVAFIGDSTFFHSGMTGLANAVFNKHDILVVILDNGTTAMTGHQPNPGMLQDILGEEAMHLDIESVVRGLGVTECVKVRSYNLKALHSALEDMRGKKGVMPSAAWKNWPAPPSTATARMWPWTRISAPAAWSVCRWPPRPSRPESAPRRGVLCNIATNKSVFVSSSPAWADRAP